MLNSLHLLGDYFACLFSVSFNIRKKENCYRKWSCIFLQIDQLSFIQFARCLNGKDMPFIDRIAKLTFYTKSELFKNS